LVTTLPCTLLTIALLLCVRMHEPSINPAEDVVAIGGAVVWADATTADIRSTV
jgi:hypothetical protein